MFSAGHVVEAFHNKGVRVVAEVVETKEELNYLQSCTGIDFVQGYYWGMPQ